MHGTAVHRSGRHVMKGLAPGSFSATALVVIAFAVAMGYLEAAVVIYLREALGLTSFSPPVIDQVEFDVFAGIEMARELATVVMIAAVGWLAGRSWIERLAWAAVIFGTWDIVYYLGLWLAIGWPPALDTWDLLFLVPTAWVGPVWAPMVVSAALVGFGLAVARLIRTGRHLAVNAPGLVAVLTGAAVVVLSFLVDAERVLAGDASSWSGWPLFWLGMSAAVVAVVAILRRDEPQRR